jgi:hypothetical protein
MAHHARTALPISLAALLAAPARAAQPDAGPAAIAVRSGRVTAVDWGDRRLTISGPGGREELGFDRNTVVYLPEGLGTMRDVEPGVEVRAAANPDGVAAWIEVRPAGGDGGTAGPPGGPPGPSDGGAAAGAAGGRDGGVPGGRDGGPPPAGGGSAGGGATDVRPAR